MEIIDEDLDYLVSNNDTKNEFLIRENILIDEYIDYRARFFYENYFLKKVNDSAKATFEVVKEYYIKNQKKCEDAIYKEIYKELYGNEWLKKINTNICKKSYDDKGSIYQVSNKILL